MNTLVTPFMMPSDSGKHLAFHHDNYKHASLLIELNDDYTGGEIVYLTKDGPIVVDRSLGTGVMHGSDIVHGVVSHGSAARYVLHVEAEVYGKQDSTLDLAALLSE